jgi:hypothetical protein
MKKALFALALTISTLVIQPSVGRADFTITVSDGTNSITVDYDTTAVTVVGSATYSSITLTSQGTKYSEVMKINGGSVGDFTFDVTTAKSNSEGGTGTLGSNLIANLNLGDIDVTNNGEGTGTLYVTVSDQFGFPTGVNAYMSESASATLDSDAGNKTVNYMKVIYGANSYSTDPITLLPVSSSGSTTKSLGGALVGVGPASEYTMENHLEITLVSEANLTSAGNDANVIGAPAPSTWILSCAAVAVLGAGYWVRRRRSASVVLASN